MNANTETTGGPPKGYVECSKKRGRWTNSGKCWTCCAQLDGEPVVQRGEYHDWTPPIAAPAAHIERRKGQPDGYCGKEHESIFGPFTCNRTDLHDASDCKWRADMWSPPPLADAAPEPVKSCTCPHGPNTTDGKCPTHVTAGITVSGFADCACAKCSPPAQEAPTWWRANARCGFPIVSSNREAAVTAVGKHQATCEKCSAQEAPKAAPVCSRQLPSMSAPLENSAKKERSTSQSDAMCFDAGGTKCGGPVLTRHLPAYLGASSLRNLCDNHVLMRELSIEKSIGPKIGKPYVGPERLPKPQLAADWVEECLA